MKASLRTVGDHTGAYLSEHPGLVVEMLEYESPLEVARASRWLIPSRAGQGPAPESHLLIAA